MPKGSFVSTNYNDGDGFDGGGVSGLPAMVAEVTTTMMMMMMMLMMMRIIILVLVLVLVLLQVVVVMGVPVVVVTMVIWTTMMREKMRMMTR